MRSADAPADGADVTEDITRFYQPEMARVIAKQRLTEMMVLLRLQLHSGEPLDHDPGQFLQISLPGYGEAPISFCSSPTQTESFELCVAAVGNLSEAMHDLRPGNFVGVRGPYGHGFPIDDMRGRDVLCIAGGIGLAPLRSLINYVADRRSDFGRMILVYGARIPAEQLFKDDLAIWDARDDFETLYTVDEPDDTWTGRTGVVTIPLRDEVEIDAPETTAAVVGPPVMYRFVAAELLDKGMVEHDILFSLERRFKCGMGKCGHCQLNDLYVCQDGPVFRYTDLIGRSEAIEVWAPEDERE
ncbi:MAG: FAD/NAD(P)-binding protein [Armatimonadota bacterium]